MRLTGKVVIITGSGQGMGREAACLFASEGAKIILFDIDRKSGMDTLQMINKTGGTAIFIQGDVSREDAVRRAIRRGLKEFGALHILYANAGVLWRDRDKSVVDMTEEDWDTTQAINLKGAFFLAKHGIPALRNSGGGSIILVGAIAALAGFSLAQDSYACAKGALASLARSLAVQYGPENIRCNIIHPGLVDTGLQRPYLNDHKRKALVKPPHFGPVVMRVSVFHD